jgi:hypothetical protein
MRNRTRIVLAALVLALAGSAATAQDSAMQFKLGWFYPSGDGEFWSETEDVFTFDSGDLRNWTWGFSYVYGPSNHLEVGFNLDLYRGRTYSAYRDVVDQSGYSIFHDSELRMAPLSVDLRLIPAGRYGGAGGRRAKRPVWYIGGGIGANLWQYEEFGDFVDFGDPDLPIGFDRFRDSGTTFQAHALTGIELPFGRAWSFVLEGKYTWASTDLRGDFAGLGEIDLGGFSISAGGAIRF